MKQISLLLAKYQQMSTKPPVPNTNKRGGPTMADDVKLTENERKAVVDGLIINEACCWEESDRETLNSLSDVTLAKLYKQQELVSNGNTSDDKTTKSTDGLGASALGASADELDEDDGEDVAVEEETTKKGASQAGGREQPTGELNPKMKNNQLALNEQDRRDLAFARRYRMEQRQQHVNAITANVNNKFTPKQLDAMDDVVLANLAALAETRDEEGVMVSLRPSFFGQQGTAVTNAGVDEEPLTLGKIDYHELASSNGSRR
jgi:hypothetical protein